MRTRVKCVEKVKETVLVQRAVGPTSTVPVAVLVLDGLVPGILGDLPHVGTSTVLFVRSRLQVLVLYV